MSSVFAYTYEDWADLIDAFFFNDEQANNEVLFAVDEVSLAEISGLDEVAAADSLANAVLGLIGPNWAVSQVTQRVHTWRRGGAHGSHPALPFVALTVLAASRMGQYDGFAPHKFYVPLRRTLRSDDPEVGAPGSYLDHIEAIWRDVSRWTTDDRAGSRGLLLVRPPGWQYGRGLAVQHALVKSYDLRQLDLFFRRLGLVPGDVVTPGELRRALEVWAARRHEPWARRLHRVASDPDLHDYAEALLERAARRWDGSLRDPRTGRAVGRLRVLLGRPRRPQLAIAAEWDQRLPAELSADNGTRLVHGQGRWYSPLPIAELDAGLAFDAGLEMRCGRQRFSFATDESYAFEYDDEIGGWVSADAIRYGHQHHLVVRSADAAQATRYLSASSTTEVRVDDRASRSLPAGWRLLTGVRLDGRPAQSPPECLSGLIPAGAGPRLRLYGGLPLRVASHTYLRGGEPVLALSTVTDDRHYSIRKGGGDVERFRADTVNGEVQLWRFGLAPDVYEIQHGASSVRFQIVDGIAESSGPGAGSVTNIGAGGIVVTGTITLPRAPQPRPVTVPAPVDGGMVIVLGSEQSDVHVVRLPSWLHGTYGPMSWTTIDAWPSFEPVWLLVKIPGDPFLVSPLGPGEPTGPIEPTSQWSRLVSLAMPRDWLDDDDRQRWQRFQLRAAAST